MTVSTARLLDEASIGAAHTMVAITDDDETEYSQFAFIKTGQFRRVITLVNKPTYNALIGTLGLGAIVSPRATTVSTIMQYVRRGRIKAVHNIRDGFGELIEAEASGFLSDRQQGDQRPSIWPAFLSARLSVPAARSSWGARIPLSAPVTALIVMTMPDQARKVEKLFSVHVDLF